MTAALPPLVKIVSVPAAPDAAFRRFTAELASWWPLLSHSVGEDAAETVFMDGRVGGRIIERIRGGQEAVWGTVTVWEPPHRVAFTWHPGQGPEQAEDIDVRFKAVGSRTRVELRHSGFERRGAEGPRMRRAYGIGWTYVLGLYAGRRGPVIVALKALTSMLMAIKRRRSGDPRHA